MGREIGEGKKRGREGAGTPHDFLHYAPEIDRHTDTWMGTMQH